MASAPRPLTLWERRALWVSAFVTGLAVSAMTLGIFWWWAMFIVTIPVLVVAAAAPTIWIYLSAAIISWFALRRWTFAAGLAAVIVSIALGFGASAVLNHQIGNSAQAAVANDSGAPVNFEGAETVAFLDRYDKDFCSYGCQRFLITGRAGAVLVGEPGPLDTARILVRVRVVPSQSKPCPALSPLDLTHALGPDARRFAPKACLVVDTAQLKTAALILSVTKAPLRGDAQRLPALPLVIERQEVAAFRDGRPTTLLRKSCAHGNFIAAPLRLIPLQGADTSAAAYWGEAGEFSVGTPLPIGLEAMLADPLRLAEFDDPH